MSDARHAKQPQTQPDNQSINQSMRKKKQAKSVFTAAKVRLSKNRSRRKKAHQMRDVTGNESTEEEKKQRTEWSCLCNALHYI